MFSGEICHHLNQAETKNVYSHIFVKHYVLWPQSIPRSLQMLFCDIRLWKVGQIKFKMPSQEKKEGGKNQIKSIWLMYHFPHSLRWARLCLVDTLSARNITLLWLTQTGYVSTSFLVKHQRERNKQNKPQTKPHNVSYYRIYLKFYSKAPGKEPQRSQFWISVLRIKPAGLILLLPFQLTNRTGAGSVILLQIQAWSRGDHIRPALKNVNITG